MLFCTSACCSAVALAVLCQALQKFFWFSSKQLQILTFVFYSLIGKILECPKALPPLAMSGSFWHLGWLEEHAHRTKSRHIFFFTQGFCRSREISNVPGSQENHNCRGRGSYEYSLTILSSLTHTKSSGHCCLVMSKSVTVSHNDTKSVSLRRDVGWRNLLLQNIFYLVAVYVVFQHIFIIIIMLQCGW